MAIESNCTGCGNRLSVAEEHAGKKARCPACGMIYVVGEQAGDAAEPENDFGLAPTTYGSGSQDASGENAGSDNSGAGSSPAQFWMKATDGAEYGPVDRETLGRWFQEGRVASEYQIREGETGDWQQAAVFQSVESANPYASSTNPYASSTNPYAGGATTAAAATKQYVKADQSGLVLAMGILGLFFCGIFAIVAWIMGHSALKDMQVGAMDPTNKGITQVGYYMGIVSVCLHVFGCAAYIVVVAIVVAAG